MLPPSVDYGNRIYLDEVFWGSHFAGLDRSRSGRRWLEIFTTHFVNLLEVLHVTDKDINAADVI